MSYYLRSQDRINQDSMAPSTEHVTDSSSSSLSSFFLSLLKLGTVSSAHDIVPKLNDLQDTIINLAHNHEMTDTRLRSTGRSKPMPPVDITFSGDTHEDGNEMK